MSNQRQDQRVMDKIYQLKTELKQLQAEVNVVRQPVSVSSHQLIRFVIDNQQFDPLVSGPARARNPYKVKSNCSCL